MINHKLNCKDLVWSAVILGQPTSKSNSSTFSFRGKRPILLKSKRARSYIDQFEIEILTKNLRPPSPIENDLVLVAYLFYKDNRSDLDDSQLADNLQKFGIIKNDRSLKEKHLYRCIDKLNPRAEIYLYRLSSDAL